MTRLVLRATLRNIRMWIAAIPLIALTTAVLVAVFSMRTAGQGLQDLEEEEAGLMDNYTAVILALTLIAALAAVGVAVDRAASRSRQRIGFFAIAGLSPTYASTLFYHQVVALAGLAVLLGLGLGAAMTPGAVELVVWAGAGHVGVIGAVDAHALVGAGIITMGVSVMASVRGAQVARSVQPVEAIKALPWTPQRSARPKAFVALIAAVGAVGAAVACLTIPGRMAFAERPLEAANWVVALGTTMAGCLAILFTLTASAYCPRLIRAWTIILPESHAPTLLLGRRGAAYQAGRSLNAFALVLVGTLIVGSAMSIYFARSSLDPAGRGWVETRDISAAVQAGVPVAFALVAAVVTVAITARNRFAEAQTLRLVGATGRQILQAGFVEAMILAVTASLVGLGGVVLVALAVGAGISNVAGSPGWPGAYGLDWLVWVAPLGVTVLGMALVTATSLPSLIRGLRHPMF
ncbi:MAG: hypothetical protein LBR27_02700 [Bifidobacteriaceae bacterium]|jgi:putative ABC transport system permease protein|nr:hypothetical protein [Bifidobacteriaceae bacterium]